jgi:hypothetical protein
MKILREFFEPTETENVLVEGKNGEKDIFVKGVFAQAETKNRNGRIYPNTIMERELYKLQKMIAEDKLTGELDHPEKPEVLLQNAAIKILNLQKNGNNVIGEARIMKSTPKGGIAYGLAKEGIKFGTSTRGLGSLQEKEGINVVQEDFNWLTNDLVADPSAPDAWVDSIMEQADYYIEKGYIKENVVGTYKNRLANISKEEGENLKEKTVKLFDNFLKEI